jgi:hypothetical protein
MAIKKKNLFIRYVHMDAANKFGGIVISYNLAENNRKMISAMAEHEFLCHWLECDYNLEGYRIVDYSIHHEFDETHRDSTYYAGSSRLDVDGSFDRALVIIHKHIEFDENGERIT